MFTTRSSFLTVAFIVMLLAVITGATWAKGGSKPAPSGTGGNIGSPGMSGSAANAGRTSGQLPQTGGTTMQGDSGTGGVDSNRSLPNGGGGSGAARRGDTTTAGSLGRPADPTGQGQSSTFSQFYEAYLGRGGIEPPSGSDGNGWQSRFGERGSGSLKLSGFQIGEGQSWANIGGFGASSEGQSPVEVTTLEGAPWQPDGSSSEIPAAPSPLEDLKPLTDVQFSLEAALAQASGQLTPQVEQATIQAQQTYDQLWEDYYAAVDYTAQVYYDTVTASADYLLQSYQEAVSYTTAAIDYYVTYADQYAAYCALYPWDCYSYTYDVATTSYLYVGDVSNAPVTTVEIGDVTVNVAYPPVVAPAPSAEAYEALVVFANDQLGAVIEPLYAGDATGEIQQIMYLLPQEMQAYLLNMTGAGVKTFWGLVNGGVAAVSVGDCDTGNCTLSVDTLAVEMSSASGGLYGLLANTLAPANPSDALRLIVQVYPKLGGLAFAQIVDVEQGFAFTATAAGIGIDPDTAEPLSVAKVVYAGVVDVNGKPFVYALVAVGEKYVMLATS